MKKMAIQPIYAYKFTSTSYVRVRGPQDTTIEFTGKGDTARVQGNLSTVLMFNLTTLLQWTDMCH